MREPNIVTVIAEIAPDRLAPLQKLLETRVERGAGHSSPLIPFPGLPHLHFASFCIVRSVEYEGQTLPEYLVMEATFDGPTEDFLADLIDLASAGLCAIFEHCRGFPQRVDDGLLSDFLTHRIVAQNAYFTGFPGRSVAQIRLEARMRAALSELAATHYGPAHPPARHLDLIRQFRRRIRARPDLAIAEQLPRLAWAVRYGDLMMRLAAGVIGLVALAAGVAALALCGMGFLDLLGMVDGTLAETGAIRLIFIALLVHILLRVFEAACLARANPDDPQIAYDRLAAFASMAALGAAAGAILAALSLAMQLSLGARSAHGAVDPWIGCIWFLLTCTAVFVVLFFRSKARRDLSWLDPRLAKADWLRAGERCLTLIWRLAKIVVLVAVYWMADQLFAAWVMETFELLIRAAAVFAVYLVAGGLILVTAQTIGLGIVHLLEKRENARYLAARSLIDRQLDRDHVWAREEHHTNATQNHFASIVLVKPNWLRRQILRATLAAVDYVGRYRNYSGTLGGIPTIQSARWILLDRGKRLLFLTNYVGAWDSYLNEFSELDAVSAVNAVWSNTYLRFDPGQEAGRGREDAKISFPKTRYLFGKGARATPEFKAYVRQSQIPTLAWYGAYPDLSVPAINRNSELRRRLFEETKLPEREDFLRRI